LPRSCPQNRDKNAATRAGSSKAPKIGKKSGYMLNVKNGNLCIAINETIW
jgi:hypothetical protein